MYTRHARLIEMAARSGGDPVMNPSLRTAIENARAENVPNANIERAIKKGTGELKGEAMREILYAAYGPGGVAFLIECLTDNTNRTLSNVRALMNHSGGSFAESSSVAWMFDRKGVVVAHSSDDAKNVAAMELELIDFGAEEIEDAEGSLSVTTGITNWTAIRDFLKANGWAIDSAGLKYIAKNKQAVHDVATAEKVFSFIEAIETDDDVSEVHSNAEIAQEILEKMKG